MSRVPLPTPAPQAFLSQLTAGTNEAIARQQLAQQQELLPAKLQALSDAHAMASLKYKGMSTYLNALMNSNGGNTGNALPTVSPSASVSGSQGGSNGGISVTPSGQITTPNGTVISPSGSILSRGGSSAPTGSSVNPNSNISTPTNQDPLQNLSPQMQQLGYGLGFKPFYTPEQKAEIAVQQANAVNTQKASLATHQANTVNVNATNLKIANNAYTQLQTYQNIMQNLDHAQQILKSDPGIFHIGSTEEGYLPGVNDPNRSELSTSIFPQVMAATHQASQRGGIGALKAVTKYKLGIDQPPARAAGQIYEWRQLIQQDMKNYSDLYTKSTGQPVPIAGVQTYVEKQYKDPSEIKTVTGSDGSKQQMTRFQASQLGVPNAY